MTRNATNERRGRKRKSETMIIRDMLEEIEELNGNIDSLHHKVDVLNQRMIYYLRTRRNLLTKNGRFNSQQIEQSSRKVGG